MKIEVRGETEKLRTLKRALETKFQCVEFETGWMEVLIVKVFVGSSDCGRVRDFIEAFCVGAGTTWNGSSF